MKYKHSHVIKKGWEIPMQEINMYMLAVAETKISRLQTGHLSLFLLCKAETAYLIWS